MVTRETVERVVRESHLWDGAREQTHAFRLSPSVYEITRSQLADLEAIAIALHECLAGLGRIAAIAATPKVAGTQTWRQIHRIINTGSPKLYKSIMYQNPSRLPVVCKVDLMEDETGAYRIAEIDGHNKHGLGYSTLGARLRRVAAPERPAFPGVARVLASEVMRRNKNDPRLVLLYANQERFYDPEFRILANELAEHGVELVVANEKWFDRVSEARGARLFVDLPFMYKETELNTRLTKEFLAGEIDFLIPPKPFLGSKAVLALIRNDEGNPELEAILRSQIPARSLEVMRRFIPPTFLVGKHRPLSHWQNLAKDSRFVLKESISCGMKGTFFSDGPRFDSMLQTAANSHFRFILQQEVTNRARAFEYFNGKPEAERGEWFMRVTVHFGVRSIADVIVTARQDKEVHGAKDCLQLGAVLP